MDDDKMIFPLTLFLIVSLCIFVAEGAKSNWAYVASAVFSILFIVSFILRKS
jgi:hypothetical protein